MSLKNENIGIAVGAVIVVIGMVLTDGDPGKLASALIAVLCPGVAYGLSYYLNIRDGIYEPLLRQRRNARR